jgi:predicted GIY-YIG superfamily endonuclease
MTCVLYYLKISDEQYGIRYIIGITHNYGQRLRAYTRRHTHYTKTIFIYEFSTKRDALNYETLIKYIFWSDRRPGTTEEYSRDILNLFSEAL